MPTLALRFQFQPRPDVDALLAKCGAMIREAVDWAIQGGKTATHTIVQELYRPFRERYPELHSVWVVKSSRTAAAIVHAFRRRKRRGREPQDRPKIRKIWVYVDKATFQWTWDGTALGVRIAVRPKDAHPIVLRFRPHGKYRRLIEAWARGECTGGEPTMLIIPLKFPDLPVYEPKNVWGMDSNERSLDVWGEGEPSPIPPLDTSFVARVSADHDRRIQKGCRGKQNPQAKEKIQRKHGRRRRNRVRAFWHEIACAFVGQALRYARRWFSNNSKGSRGASPTPRPSGCGGDC